MKLTPFNSPGVNPEIVNVYSNGRLPGVADATADVTAVEITVKVKPEESSALISLQ